MGEPAATKCLALMFQAEHRLEQATLRWLSDLMGVELGSVHHFESEVVHEDGGRADREGLDSQGRPVLMVEAKFGAVLAEGQLVSYLLDQQVRLDGGPGALVVLVPEARMDRAESMLTSAKALVNVEAVPVAVVSWDAWMDSWDDVIDHDTAGDFLLRSDVSQLRGLVRTLGGLLGRPYAPNSDIPWIQWEQDLVGLVSEFTREVNGGQGRSAGDLPIQSRNTEFAPARYVFAAKRPSKDAFLLVGLSRD